MESRGDQDLLALAAELVISQDPGFGTGSSSVVMRGVGAVHAGQAGDEALVFKDALQRPLGDLRLVGCVGGVKLSAADQVVDGSRDIVVIGTGAEKTHRVGERKVGFGHLFELGGGFHLRHAVEHTELREAVLFRNGREKIFDLFHADGPQHLLPFGFSVRNKH